MGFFSEFGVNDDTIRTVVRSGLCNRSDIEYVLDDYFDARDGEFEDGDPGYTDNATAMAAVDAELAKKAQEEDTWAPTTDCDRLEAVFAQLDGLGIMPFVNDRYSGSLGWNQAYEEIEVHQRQDPPRYWGFCYLHTTDMALVLKGEGLSLIFGGCSMRDGSLCRARKADIEAGKVIKRVLQEHGFKVRGRVSNGGFFIPDFQWQRRTPAWTPPLNRGRQHQPQAPTGAR
jgi:hypothetical protein